MFGFSHTLLASCRDKWFGRWNTFGDGFVCFSFFFFLSSFGCKSKSEVLLDHVYKNSVVEVPVRAAADSYFDNRSICQNILLIKRVIVKPKKGALICNFLTTFELCDARTMPFEDLLMKYIHK